MKKVVFTFGSISGIIVSALMLIGMSVLMGGDKPNFESGELVGYVSMLIALSAIFFGIRSYRDKYLDGLISFGKAFVVGLYITIVASSFYVVSWMIYSETTAGDKFMEHFMEYSIEQIKNSGASAESIETEIQQTAEFMEMYKNPFVKIGFTFLEIFPIGLLISLICSWILKSSSPKKNITL